MSSRAQALAAVKIDDLIFGIRDDGRTDLLLVYKSNDAAFWGRNVFNQTTYKFDRNGEGRRAEDGQACTVISTARLPEDMHEIALGLDRKSAAKPKYPDSKLSQVEIRLLLWHGDFFKANLLPPVS